MELEIETILPSVGDRDRVIRWKRLLIQTIYTDPVKETILKHARWLGIRNAIDEGKLDRALFLSKLKLER